MKLTEIFGKQVYSLYEGEVVGTASEAVFNKPSNRITAFKIFDKNEHEYLLTYHNIKALADYIIINNQNKLDYFLDSSKNSPIFKIVIDENAKSLGRIIDAIVGKNGIIESFLTDKNIILAPDKMLNRKDFVYYGDKPISINKLKPKSSAPSLPEIKVNILTDFSRNDNFSPTKLQYNPTSIIGKIAKNDLYGINNEIIIKANQQITEKIIDDATRHNRLNQLYYIAI